VIPLRYLTFAGKIAAGMVAGLGALTVSALAGIYAVVLCAGSIQGVAANWLFLAVVLTALICLGLALSRLSWSWRAVVGVLLVAGGFMLLPRPSCAAEPESHVEC
jgi:hypothetical protein